MPCYSCRSCGKNFFHFYLFQLSSLIEWRNSRWPEAREMVLCIFSPGVSRTNKDKGDGSWYNLEYPSAAWPGIEGKERGAFHLWEAWLIMGRNIKMLKCFLSLWLSWFKFKLSLAHSHLDPALYLSTLRWTLREAVRRHSSADDKYRHSQGPLWQDWTIQWLSSLSHCLQPWHLMTDVSQVEIKSLEPAGCRNISDLWDYQLYNDQCVLH